MGNIIISAPHQMVKSLAELAAQIDLEHSCAEAAMHDGLGHAARAGSLLREAKTRVAHGEWLAWLQANCKVTPRTAQRYMKLAAHWGEIAAKGGESLGLHRALELLAHENDDPGGPNATRASHLPAALAFYHQDELINQAALDHLLELADDYGPDVLTYLPFARLPRSAPGDWAFLNGIRPLDHPPLWPFFLGQVETPGTVAVAAATKVFLEDGCARSDLVPQWEVTAFWFASTMVHLADAYPEMAEQFAIILHQNLELWRAHFRTAIYIVGCLGRDFLEEEDRDKLWMGYQSDLKHAGALAIIRELGKDPRAHPLYKSLEAMYGEWANLGFILPSGMQGRLDRFNPG